MFHTLTQDIFHKPSEKLETDRWWKEMVIWRTFRLSYSKWTNQIPPLSVEPVGESATLLPLVTALLRPLSLVGC